jgi:hypothetical protein
MIDQILKIHFKHVAGNALLLLIIISLTTSFAFAQPLAFERIPGKEQVLKKDLILKDGSIFPARITAYYNQIDELEVRIETNGLPEFSENLNPLIGFGRDTDGNDRIDTWFLITPQGIEVSYKEGYNIFGLDVLPEVLKSKFNTNFEMHLSSAVNSLLSYISLTADKKQQLNEDYYQRWMDIEEAKSQFLKSQKKLITSDRNSQSVILSEKQKVAYLTLQKANLIHLQNDMKVFSDKTVWGYAAADVGFVFSGTFLFKSILKGLKYLAPKKALMDSTLIASMDSAVKGFLKNHKLQINTELKALDSLAESKGLPLRFTQGLLNATIARQSLQQTLKGYKVKQLLLKGLEKALPFGASVLKAAASEWKYLALNSTVQATSEFFANYDELYNPDPLVMAGNFLKNDSILKNMRFMATETLFMVGLSKNIRTLKGRFLASGAFALTNSTISNIVLSDKFDAKRVALDTTWEVLIGNSQVQLDVASLAYFESLALKQQNPRLKLIGYGVSFLDMGVGYFTYSHAATALDNLSGPAPKQRNYFRLLTPIYVNDNLSAAE